MAISKIQILSRLDELYQSNAHQIACRLLYVRAVIFHHDTIRQIRYVCLGTWGLQIVAGLKGN